jgi:hypothetical protein
VRWLLLALIFSSLVFGAPAQGKNEILANFAGTLKRITSRELIIEPEEGNEIMFLRTRRTRFLDKNGKAVSELDFKVGDAVAVEASQKLNTELEAVNVRHVARLEPEEK